MISSIANPTIQRVRRLRKRSWRERERQFLLEGHRSVATALRGTGGIAVVLHTPRAATHRRDLLETSIRAGARVHEIAPAIMAHLTDAASAPDVLGVGVIREIVDAVIPSPTLVLSHVHDPATAGGLVALAAALGMRSVVVLPGTADLYEQKAARASGGAYFHLDVIRPRDPKKALDSLRAAGPVAALDDQGIPLRSSPLRGCAGLIVGTDPTVAARADVRVRAPGGIVEPSIAAQGAFLLYEWVRQNEER